MHSQGARECKDGMGYTTSYVNMNTQVQTPYTYIRRMVFYKEYEEFGLSITFQRVTYELAAKF